MRLSPATPEDTTRFARFVRRMQFFGSMSMPMLERILTVIQVGECAKGERVCEQGGPGDAFFVVAEGRLVVRVKKGLFFPAKEVANLEPGDCFGEMALLRQVRRNATVECLTPCRVFVLSAAHFQAVARENPAFLEEMEDLSAWRQIDLDYGTSRAPRQGNL